MLEDARSPGARHLRIALRHIVTSTVSPLIVRLSVAVGAAILAEANRS